jgi:glycosyltransferase involved in cell wall biosynthesis
MKIFINGRFLSQSITGVQRYAHEVIRTLDILLGESKLVSEDEFILLFPKDFDGEIPLKNISTKKVGFLKGHAWEQFELPFYANNHLLINLCNTAPALKRKQIVTIHDAAVYYSNSLSLSFRIYYKFLYKFLSIFSKYIITDSKFSYEELIKYLKVNPQKLKIIYLSGEHIKRIKENDGFLRECDLVNKPFALAVSSLNPSKNFGNILKATKQINGEITLIIAGNTNPKVFKEKKLIFNKNVQYLGYISDQELITLYKNALVFLYPSLYEGFGLPPLEAMTIGCPVIVSNRASLPEVCGSAAIYCDPINPRDIAYKVNTIYNDSSLRRECIINGQKRSNEFSWNKCVSEILDLVNKFRKEEK